MMSEGMFLGWSSPSLPKLLAADSPIPITPDQSSWIASIIGIGNVIAAIFSSKLVDVFGRKNIMFLATLPASLAWILTAIATTPQELYAARILAGMAMGISYMATAIYLTEISPAKIRGMVCGMFSPAIILGEIVVFVMGPRLSISTTAWISLIAPMIFLTSYALIPESPYYLVLKGKFDQAEKSLRRLRGTSAVEEELRTLRTTAETNSSNRGGLRDLLLIRSNRKALFIAVCLSAAPPFSGISAILAYSQTIFTEVSSYLGDDISLLPVTLRFVCCCICSAVVDRVGRKPLLIASTIGTGLSTFTVGLYFFLKSYGIDVQPYSWIPVVAITMFSVTLSIGLASLGNVIVGELFPLNVRAVGNCVFRCGECFWQFLVIKLYQVVADNVGVQYAFWGFTTCSLLSMLLMIFILPETKGKTLEQIQVDMKNLIGANHNAAPLIVKKNPPNHLKTDC